jgi:diaminopimelate decarboxylase
VTLSDLVRPALARIASRLDPGTGTQMAGITPQQVRDACVRYRRAVRWAGVACPAETLLAPDTADWVRKHGVPVDVRSSDELALVVSAGIKPARIVMHGDGGKAGPLRCAVNAGVGQFVVSSGQQVAILAHWARIPQRVLVDVTTQPADGLSTTVLGADRMELIGLYCRVDDDDRFADVVGGMVEEMAQIRWDRGVLVTRLSLATTVSGCPRRMGETIEDALDEACARFRFPRPSVALSLRWPVLRPQ